MASFLLPFPLTPFAFIAVAVLRVAGFSDHVAMRVGVGGVGAFYFGLLAIEFATGWTMGKYAAEASLRDVRRSSFTGPVGGAVRLQVRVGVPPGRRHHG